MLAFENKRGSAADFPQIDCKTRHESTKFVLRSLGVSPKRSSSFMREDLGKTLVDVPLLEEGGNATAV